MDKSAVIPTLRLPKERIEQKNAPTLSEAVAGESGVDAQTSCATCGSKRVTVNGLRGEHTTILVDGVPLHSAVSSFYGVDAEH
ncbi:MAG: Plug domain-containing protein, partial [Proteobacteria bacterium]|nr:Plug domain-containing protein [Pseudomonadota bacterium]